jgi:hypothetical protein
LVRLSHPKWIFISSTIAIILVVFGADVAPRNGGHPATVAAPSCLVSIQADAQMGYYQNSSFNGNVVSFPNGTKKFFSYYSCPRPAMGEARWGSLAFYNFTTNVFAMAVAAENNRTFVTMNRGPFPENGTSYIYYTDSGLGCYVGTDKCGLDLYFYRYGNNVSHPCASARSFAMNILGGISVEFTTTGQRGADGRWISHGWDLSNPKVRAVSSIDIKMLNLHGC